MNKNEVSLFLKEFAKNDATARISSERARQPSYAGLRFFGEPLVGFAAAEDDYIRSLEKNEEAGIDLRQPEAWIENPRTIISWFFPYSEEILASNRLAGGPSELWQQGRVDGQLALIASAEALTGVLCAMGYQAVSPISDSRLELFMDFEHAADTLFTSNWSERHIAYAAGLGTFSLSKGLITKKGMAGRFASIVTSLSLEPTPRPYAGLYEYCSWCGACVSRCPGGAITKEGGKNHNTCALYLRTVTSADGAYYGCGKCQCAVPCETKAPCE